MRLFRPIQLSLRAKLYFSFACAVIALCSGVLIARYLSGELAENLNTITGSAVPAIRNIGQIDSAVKGMSEAVNTLWFASSLAEGSNSPTLDR